MATGDGFYIMRFVELTLPIKDKKKDKWYVVSQDFTWILKTIGTIGKLITTDAKECYFDSVMETHIAAAVYYSYFNEDYPHMAEWEACIEDNSEVAGTVEQEIMEFI